MFAGKSFADHTILFVGAGEAAIGIADLCCKAMEADGISSEVSQISSLIKDTNLSHNRMLTGRPKQDLDV